MWTVKIITSVLTGGRQWETRHTEDTDTHRRGEGKEPKDKATTKKCTRNIETRGKSALEPLEDI